ncbi:MAG TPA: hypothetical protein VF742_05860, partial [Terracidiphilus sp.]
LQRQYREGHTLVYRMNGINENWHYSLRATGVVKKDGASRFYEEYQWSFIEPAASPSAQTSDFRQHISLDSDQNPSLPDLSKVDPKMIGPITDFMTFYADLWLANKLGQLNKPGDHFYFRNPMPPSSWADGTRVLVGLSVTDFDMTLKSVDAATGTAMLEVRHVPPEKSALPQKAAWMQDLVGSAPNNWMTIEKEADGFHAGVGEETFDALIKVSLMDGRILSATLENPVKTIERICTDEALTQCGPRQPHLIVRKIEIEAQ